MGQMSSFLQGRRFWNSFSSSTQDFDFWTDNASSKEKDPMPSPVTKFQKPHSLIVMVAKSGRLSAIGRRILNLLLLHTWQQIRDLKQAGHPVLAEHMFEAPILEISQKVSRKESDPRSLVKKYFLEMRKFAVDWSSPEAKNGVIFSDMNILSEAQIEIRKGVAWARWAFPPSLINELMKEKVFYSWIDMEEMLSLDSYASIALYEICLRYKDNPRGLTCVNPPEWWSKAISNSSYNEKEDDGSEKFREWRKIKNEAVNKAVLEVNSKTSLTIEMIETKVGKSVVSVQFSIQKKKIEVGVDESNKVDYQLAMIAARLDIGIPKVSSLSKEGFSDADLHLGLTQLESRMKATNLEPVENKVSYLRKMLEGNKGKTKPSIVTGPDANPVEIPKKTWVEERRADVKKEFEGLSEGEQRRFAEAGAELLKAAKLLSPSVIRSMNSGDWKKGVILAKAVEAYGIEKYGVNWLFEA